MAGVLNSVVSLYYYAAVVKKMYLEAAPANPLPEANSSPEANFGGPPIPLTALDRLLLAALLVPTVLFGVWPTPLMRLAAFSLNLF